MAKKASSPDATRLLRRSKRLAVTCEQTDSTTSAPISKAKSRSKQAKEPKLSKTDVDIDHNDGNSTEQSSKPLYKLSSMAFPRLDAPRFGVAQEQLADDPFKVLIACVFLTRTKGSVSMPVCRELFRRYPTPQSLADADVVEITLMFQPLGLQNRRAKTVINLAKAWIECPPTRGRLYSRPRYRVRKVGSEISRVRNVREFDEDWPVVAWEIFHLPGIGDYALDSWRIFCRDSLRGIPSDLQDMTSPNGAAHERKQEWTSVIPLDKELIAYIRWRWLRLNYLWNPVKGSKIKVDGQLIELLQNQEVDSYKGFDNPWVVYGANPQRHSNQPVPHG